MEGDELKEWEGRKRKSKHIGVAVSILKIHVWELDIEGISENHPPLSTNNIPPKKGLSETSIRFLTLQLLKCFHVSSNFIIKHYLPEVVSPSSHGRGGILREFGCFV